MVAGIASSKIAAELLGPDGVGLMGIVLSTVGVVQIIAGGGVGQAIVRFCGADESAGLAPPHREWVSTARTVVAVASVVSIAASAALVPVLSDGLFGDGSPRWWLPAVVATGCLYAGFQLQLRTLVAHHHVRAVARASVLVAFISPAVNAVLFATLDLDGVVPGALVANVLVMAVVSMVVRWELRLADGEPRSVGPRRFRRLTAEGLPLVPAQLLGSVTVLALLLLIQDELSREDVGYYRAATAIALGYMVLVNTSISQDFFPRVARTVHDPAEFSRVCDEQITLVVRLATPVVVAVNMALPVLVPILYTREFSPTISVLEWQITGDLLKLVGSILATALLAKSGSWIRVGTEAVGAAALVACSLIGLELIGFRGLGVGYLVAYVIYLVGVLGVLSRVGYTPTRDTVRLLVFATTASLSVPVAVLVLDSDWGRLVGVPVLVLTLISAAPLLGGRFPRLASLGTRERSGSR